VSPRHFARSPCESVRSAAELVNTARRAEIAGYATFLIRDHFIEEPFGTSLRQSPALATVAAARRSYEWGAW